MSFGVRTVRTPVLILEYRNGDFGCQEVRPCPLYYGVLNRPAAMTAAIPIAIRHSRPRAPRAWWRGATLVALTAATTLLTVAPPVRAQDSVLTEEGRAKRSKSLAITGALLGGVVGFAFGSTQKPPAYSIAVGGAVIGGLIGLVVGKQYDELHAAQFRGARPLTLRTTDAELEGDPASLAVEDSLIAVGGSEGVQMLVSDVRLVPQPTLRARGLLGISTVDVAPASEWLALGAENGLYLFPPARGRGVLVNSGHVAAVAATKERVYSASGEWVMVTPVQPDSAAAHPAADLHADVRALVIDRAREILWAASDTHLIAFRLNGDSLERISDVAIDGGARRVAAQGTRVAVAVGERGVRVFDVTDPAHPVAHAPWTLARFAYDVSLDGKRMFVAAGPEGVYVCEFHDSRLITLGLARGLGFASAIVSRDGYTYLLDRRTDKLHRFGSDF